MAKLIEQPILDVYDIKRKRGEDDQAYFERIVRTSNAGTDAQWASLDGVKLGTSGVGAQDWINAGGQAIQDKKDIEPFPADGDAGEASGEAAETRPRRVAASEPEPEQRPARKANGKTAAKAKAEPKAKAGKKVAAAPKDEPAPRTRRVVAEAPAEKPAAAAKATRKRGNGGSGVYAQTQEYVVKNPNASTQDIMKALVKKGLEPQQHTVQSVRGHTRDTLKLVQRILGHDIGIENLTRFHIRLVYDGLASRDARQPFSFLGTNQ